jgi:UDP-glucose 4-epimerase
MDSEYLQSLLKAVHEQSGGLVLRVDDKPEAVVLSIEKYNEMILGLAAAASNPTATPEAIKEAAPPPKPTTILVTGGAGYIGAHTVRQLLAEGAIVIVLDNLSTGKREYVPTKAHFYEGDICDVQLLQKIFSEHSIDAVFHFAAKVGASESIDQPLDFLEINVEGVATVSRVAAQAGVKSFIFSSTVQVYGNVDASLITEAVPVHPLTPYAHSKVLAEVILQFVAQTTTMRVTVLRYCTVAGMHSEWGIRPNHNMNILSDVLAVAMGQEGVLTIHGNDYATADGTSMVDYIHVQDVAAANMLAIRNLGTDKFRVYNVGPGKGLSISRLVTLTTEVIERMIPVEIAPRRKGDMAAGITDIQKIKTELEFTPRFSDPANIILSMWQRPKSSDKLGIASSVEAYAARIP